MGMNYIRHCVRAHKCILPTAQFASIQFVHAFKTYVTPYTSCVGVYMFFETAGSVQLHATCMYTCCSRPVSLCSTHATLQFGTCSHPLVQC